MPGLGFSIPDLGLRVGKATTGYTFGGAIPAGVSLTRGSAATLTDPTGALTNEGANAARFDHDPRSHALRGLLIEGAATNAALNSQDWTQASWSGGKVNLTATTIVETLQGGFHRIAPAAATRVLASGTPVTMSCIAAELAGSAKRYLGLTLGATGFAAQPSATFDLDAGTVTQVANGTAGCEPAPGGWLCWLSATPSASVSNAGELYYLSNDSANAMPGYTGDGGSGLAVSEMQFETGAAATSRIRTGIASATRAADVLTLAGSSGTWRFTFDDGSHQDAALVASGGVVTAPALDRPWLVSAAMI